MSYFVFAGADLTIITFVTNHRWGGGGEISGWGHFEGMLPQGYVEHSGLRKRDLTEAFCSTVLV